MTPASGCVLTLPRTSQAPEDRHLHLPLHRVDPLLPRTLPQPLLAARHPPAAPSAPPSRNKVLGLQRSASRASGRELFLVPEEPGGAPMAVFGCEGPAPPSAPRESAGVGGKESSGCSVVLSPLTHVLAHLPSGHLCHATIPPQASTSCPFLPKRKGGLGRGACHGPRGQRQCGAAPRSHVHEPSLGGAGVAVGSRRPS